MTEDKYYYKHGVLDIAPGFKKNNREEPMGKEHSKKNKEYLLVIVT